MSTTRIIFKNTVLNLVSIVSIAVFAFFTSVVIARSLGPDRMGLYSYVLWVLEVGTVAVNLGILNTTMRYIGEALGRSDQPLAHTLTGRFFKVQLGLGLVVGLLIGLFSIFGQELFDVRAAAPLLALPIALIPVTLNNYFNAVNRGYQRYKPIAWSGVAVSLVSFLLIWRTASSSGDLVQIVLWLALANGLGLIIYFYALKKDERSALIRPNYLEPTFTSRLTKYSAALSVLVVCELIVWQKSEIFFLAFYADTQSVAFYSLAFTLALSAVAYLPTAFTGLLTPMFSALYGQFNTPAVVEKFLLTSLRYVLLVSLPLAMGVSVLIRPIVLIIYGPAFQPVSSVFPLLAAAALLSVLSGVFSAALFGLERQKFLLKAVLGVTILNLGLDIALIPLWGLWGAVLANLVAQLAAFCLISAYLYRRLKFHPFEGTFIIRLFFATALIGLALWPIGQLSDPRLAILLGIIAWLIATYLALWLCRCWQLQDLERFESLTESAPRVKQIMRWILKPIFRQFKLLQ